MNPFPSWINVLPEAYTPFEGLEGRLVASPHGQTVFFHAVRALEVPTHAHGAQWGVVVSGNMEMTIGGEKRTYGPGDSYDIPAGVTHSSRLEADVCIIDVFQDPNQLRPKVRHEAS